jgi:hypothetical protein
MTNSTETYNEEWFKKRALASLKKVDDTTWDYTDSLLLYSPQGATAYTNAQEETSPYYISVIKPELEHLNVVAEEVSKILPQSFDFIALGPGTGEKEVYFLDVFKKQGKDFTYIPIDVSDHFLRLATEGAQKKNIIVAPKKISFEEFSKIEKGEKIRFVSLLGLTFSNYTPASILQLLRDVAGVGGYIFIDTQIAERSNLVELKDIYQKYVAPACTQKIRLIGLDPMIDVSERLADEQITISCFLKHANEILQNKGLKNGDKIILFQSLRSSKDSFEKMLSTFSSIIFDKDGSYISALIKT